MNTMNVLAARPTRPLRIRIPRVRDHSDLHPQAAGAPFLPLTSTPLSPLSHLTRIHLRRGSDLTQASRIYDAPASVAPSIAVARKRRLT